MEDIHSLLRAHFLGKTFAGIRELHSLSGLSELNAAAFVGVSVGTFARWRSDAGRMPSRAVIRLLCIRGGLMPWPDWRGWLCRDGRLFPPGWAGTGLGPGEVAAIPFYLQRISALERELRELRSVANEQEKPAESASYLGELVEISSRRQFG